MARALFETFNISACELFSFSFCFVLKVMTCPNLFSCDLTTEEEAAALKRLVLLNVNFSADRTKFQAIA